MTFWEHLDELRGTLLKIVAAVGVMAIAAFCFKGLLFDIILAPKYPDFATYRLIDAVCQTLGLPETEGFSVDIINTGLAGQFVIHVKMAAYAGLLVASPYVLYLLFRFVSPALYATERRNTLCILPAVYAMFMAGLLLSYFLIFPFTFRFLGTYQISPDVPNLITLESYVDTLMMLSLTIGLVFEMPMLCYVMARLGLLKPAMMRHFRRHSIIAILVLSAIITPTADAFTMLLVAMPVCLLYEMSILIVSKAAKERR